MLKNYLKIAWRNLIKNKVFSIANIVGLTCAFAVAILLSMTALFELSFDQFHENKDSAYQLYLTNQTPRGTESSTSSPVPLAGALKEEVPGIKRTTRTLSEDALVSYKEKDFSLDGEYVDPDFFNIFTFPVIAGNPENPFSSKSSVSITQETALKIFGTTDVVGEVVQIRTGAVEHPFTIASILENIPSNSSMDFDIAIPFENHPEYADNMDRWDSQFHLVYLELEDGITPEQFEENTREFTSIHYKGSIENAIRDGAVANADGLYKQFHLQPIADIHFTSFATGTAEVKRTFPYMILGIAFVILFIVCANFINMNI
ncbi:MAG: ABC transporter permease, partial [Bacteroidota bacterium]|nr:ABC transporter permease [Bacteroidota bacterium]